jgi:hypothetical protein
MKSETMRAHIEAPQENAFVDELEKIAIDPATMLLTGAGTHLLANAAIKASHGTRFIRGVRAGRLARGISRGVSGAPQSLGSRMAERWVAPELISNEHIGNLVGEQLRGMSKGRRYRTLKKLRKVVASDKHLRHAPIFEDVVGGVNRALDEGIPRAGSAAQPGRLRRAFTRVAAEAPAPIMAAVEPGALAHRAVNATRMAVANSKGGRAYLRRTAREGFMRGASNPDAIVASGALDRLMSRVRGDPMAQIALADPRVQAKIQRSFPGGVDAAHDAVRKARDAMIGTVQRDVVSSGRRKLFDRVGEFLVSPSVTEPARAGEALGRSVTRAATPARRVLTQTGLSAASAGDVAKVRAASGRARRMSGLAEDLGVDVKGMMGAKVTAPHVPSISAGPAKVPTPVPAHVQNMRRYGTLPRMI